MTTPTIRTGSKRAAIREVVEFLRDVELLRDAPRIDESVGQRLLSGTAPLHTATPDRLAFAGASVDAAHVATSRAGLVLVDSEATVPAADFTGSGAVVRVAGARLAHALVLEHFFVDQPPAGVHPSAVVDESAVLAPDVSVGPSCFIGPDVRIGSGSRLDAGVRVMCPATIGERVWIQAGVVIGSHAFSYERSSDGSVVRVPQLGGVTLEDDVEVGANAVIDRGSSGDTVVHRMAKIGHLCIIGHNAEIGAGTFVVGMGGVAGSSVVGESVWLGPMAMVRDHVTVGDRTFIGMGASVIRSLPADSKVLPPRATVRSPVPDTSPVEGVRPAHEDPRSDPSTGDRR